MKTAGLAAMFVAGYFGLLPAQSGMDRRLIVLNATSMSVVSFQASNARHATWEENLLHGKVLRPGGVLVADLDDGSSDCLFDIRVIFDDGSPAVQNGLDVCITAGISISEKLEAPPTPSRRGQALKGRSL